MCIRDSMWRETKQNKKKLVLVDWQAVVCKPTDITKTKRLICQDDNFFAIGRVVLSGSRLQVRDRNEAFQCVNNMIIFKIGRVLNGQQSPNQQLR